nr:penicillin-binding protein 1C [candidate division Zixibacteria bacterium]
MTVRKVIAIFPGYRRVSRIALGVIILAATVIMLDRVICPLPTNRLVRASSHFVYSRDGHLLCSFSSRDRFWRKPVRLEEISPKLVRTVIACEDRWYWYHPGFNPVSLITAAVDNLRAGRVVRGGSTITMQIARMMESRPRTITAKLIELFRAIQLEMHYSKNELLEIYFNLVPYGGNIEGVGAASFFYFGKNADQLTLSEAAILTAIPSSPNLFRPDLNPASCRHRRNQLLEILTVRGVIDSMEYKHALAEDIPEQRTTRSFIAPHFAQDIISRYPDTPVHRTTIDFNTQVVCEKLATDYHRTLIEKNIHNLSIVVLDNQTGGILALVGSPDFNDRRHGGQINGAMARRSPGSALKPFVYALGFESGLISPSSRIEDIPVSYSGYSPENYDEQYHGIVAVDEALINSFNVPAVNVASRVGLEKFYQLLKDGGLRSLDNKYYEYGLPLVLGAGEVTLLELTNLYATLGREGEYIPVKEMTGQETTVKRIILSEEASYLVTDILTNLQRPDLVTSWEFTVDCPTIAWKTGTSYGRRDAWAVGYNPQYTVGVWTGNFSGEGSPYLVGAETSVPLMLAIFKEVTRGTPLKWFDRPPGIGVRRVCTVSGMPAGPDCPESKEALHIKQVSSPAVCDIHKRLLVDHDHGYLLCRSCRHTASRIDTVVAEIWPARMSRWLLAQGLTQPLPEHNSACRGLVADENPVVLSPEDKGVYVMRPEAPGEYQKIVFRASAALASGRIHWFLDDQLYATTASGSELFYTPEPGRHRLLCIDEFGRSSRVTFEIK